VDLRSSGGLVRAIGRLARRPTADAVVSGRVQAALVRLLGVQPLRARDSREPLTPSR
jgi:hypothetical protein